ncbi:MAG: hypothetical protein ACLGQX_15035 [Acidobacteriota bacterium]
MAEQSAVVERALNALRAVCVMEPEPDRAACHREAAHRPLTASACRQPIQPHGLAARLVHGKRVTVFRRCPCCASYALYRNNNVGDYECQTCGMQCIDEDTARLVM